MRTADKLTALTITVIVLMVIISVAYWAEQKQEPTWLVQTSHIEVLWSTPNMAEVCVDGYLWLHFREGGAAQVRDAGNWPIQCELKERGESK